MGHFKVHVQSDEVGNDVMRDTNTLVTIRQKQELEEKKENGKGGGMTGDVLGIHGSQGNHHNVLLSSRLTLFLPRGPDLDQQRKAGDGCYLGLHT